MYVFHVYICVLHVLLLYHLYVSVLSHASLAFPVNNTGFDSNALHATLFAVGAVFVHVAVFTALHAPLHCLSLTFTYTLYVPGSVKVFLYVTLVAPAIAFVQFAHVYH